MPIQIGAPPAPLDPELVEKLNRLSFPTLGHYLEQGFADPGLVRQVGTRRIVGRAITVRITATDSTMLHHAAGTLEPGDVLVLDTGGDLRHAAVGLVLTAAAAIRRAAGVVIDGVVTDVDEAAAYDLPVYARGRSMLTTKLHGIDEGSLNLPITCGGVVVNAGDIVLADANGVYFGDPVQVAGIVDLALQDDAEEPELIEALRAGARLGDETGATATITALAAQ
jgi:4-hydroxy-4-methyl-2-oxoglutarate aldolase